LRGAHFFGRDLLPKNEKQDLEKDIFSSPVFLKLVPMGKKRCSCVFFGFFSRYAQKDAFCVIMKTDKSERAGRFLPGREGNKDGKNACFP